MKFKKSINKSRLLAIQDSTLLVLEKVGPNKQYTLPGGVQKKWETGCHALIRETEEEIGVELNVKELSYFLTKRNITKDRREVFKHYFVTIKKIKNLHLLEPEKFKSILWIHWHEAVQYLDKEDRKAVKKYFKTTEVKTL